VYRIDATRAFSPKHIDTFEFFEGYLEGQNLAKLIPRKTIRVGYTGLQPLGRRSYPGHFLAP